MGAMNSRSRANFHSAVSAALAKSRGEVVRKVKPGARVYVGGASCIIPGCDAGQTVAIRRDFTGNGPCFGFYVDGQWVAALPVGQR
jgi:hypothetical protein